MISCICPFFVSDSQTFILLHKTHVLLGASEAEAAGLAAETVTAGDPTFAGPLTGVQLGLRVYHICEQEMKDEVDAAVYDEQISMMEMVLDVPAIEEEMQAIRSQFMKF